MADGQRHARRFFDRLGTFVLQHPRTLVVDVVILTAWATLLFGIVTLGWLPREIFYVGLFAGVISYSLVARWHDPDRSD